MNDPATPAQAPGETEIAAASSAHAREASAARRARFRRVAFIAVPVLLLLGFMDCTVGNFAVFSARAYGAEAKSTLMCLGSAAEIPAWSGVVDGAALKERFAASCFGKIAHSRYRYWRSATTVAAMLDDKIKTGDDFWIVVAGGKPVHCFDSIQPSFFVLPQPRPVLDGDSACADMLAAIGANPAALRIRPHW